MLDKVITLLTFIGFCFIISKIYSFLEKEGVFIRKDVKHHFYQMRRILEPYSFSDIEQLKIGYGKEINQIAKAAKHGGYLAKEFIEKSNENNGAKVFALIYIFAALKIRPLTSDADKIAITAIREYCKKELVKYKDTAPEILWGIRNADKEYFYQYQIKDA